MLFTFGTLKKSGNKNVKIFAVWNHEKLKKHNLKKYIWVYLTLDEVLTNYGVYKRSETKGKMYRRNIYGDENEVLRYKVWC